MAERYIKESDIQVRIDADMQIIQNALSICETQSIRNSYDAQRCKLINLVCHMDHCCDHIYREDIVNQTLDVVHKAIVKEFRNRFNSKKGSDEITITELSFQIDEILHHVLRSRDSKQDIIHNVLN